MRRNFLEIVSSFSEVPENLNRIVEYNPRTAPPIEATAALIAVLRGLLIDVVL
jgi:hypothetical protein